MSKRKSRLHHTKHSAQKKRERRLQTSKDEMENQSDMQPAKRASQLIGEPCALGRKKRTTTQQRNSGNESQQPLLPVLFGDLPADIQNKMESLITDLNDIGCESMLVVVNVATNQASQNGSSLGKLFLEKTGDMRVDFFNFCKELTEGYTEVRTTSEMTNRDKPGSGTNHRERKGAEQIEKENCEVREELHVFEEKVDLSNEIDNRSEDIDEDVSHDTGRDHSECNSMKLIDFLRRHLNRDLHISEEHRTTQEGNNDIRKYNQLNHSDETKVNNFNDCDYSENLKKLIELSKICVNEIQGRAELTVNLFEMESYTLRNTKCPLCGTTLETNDISNHMLSHKKRLETLTLETCPQCHVTLPKNYIKKHLCSVIQKPQPDEVIAVCRDLRDHIAHIEMNHYCHSFVERKCWHCITILTNPTHVKKHILHEHFHHYFCTMCEEEIETYSKIGEHFMEHEISKEKYTVIQNFKDGGNEPLQCPLCAKNFAHKRSLLRHYKANHQTRTGGSVGCNTCKRRFVSETNLIKHMVVHTQRYVCKIEDCTASFTHSHLLDKHKLKYHREYMNKFRPFLCGICGKGFLRKATLKSHTEWKHLKEECPVECEVCHKTVRNKYLLKDHYRLHNHNHQYICEKCGLVFKTNSGLYNHKMNQHTDKVKQSFSCKVCGNVYARRSYLLHHIVSTNHITVNQTLDNFNFYECDQCNKKFGTKQKFSRHVDSVHKKKPAYTCQYCDKTFSDRSNFKQHTRLHSGHEFTCEICKATFRKQSVLTKHLEQTHHEGTKPYEINTNYQLKQIHTNKSYSSNDGHNEIRFHLSKNTQNDFRSHVSNKPYNNAINHMSKDTQHDPVSHVYKDTDNYGRSIISRSSQDDLRNHCLENTDMNIRSSLTKDYHNDVRDNNLKGNSYNQSAETNTNQEMRTPINPTEFPDNRITQMGSQTYTVLTASPLMSSSLSYQTS